MKKYLGIMLFTFSLLLNVKAESLLNVECDKSSINVNEQIKCDINLTNDDKNINKISFDYETNLENNVNGNNLVNDSNHVTISLSDVNVTGKIGEIILLSNNKEPGSYRLTLSNIKLLMNNDVVSEVNNITKSFTIVDSKLDSDCTLNGIIVNGVPLSDFDKDKLSYGPIYVDTQSTFVDVVRSSEKANVSGLGTFRVKPNKNVERKIVVVAENGNKREYTLLLKYDESRLQTEFDDLVLPDTKSSDTYLKLLEIYDNDKKIEFDFAPNKTTYVVKLDDGNIKEVKILAETNNEKASFVTDYGSRVVPLSYGNNKVEIKVKAEDGTELSYTLNIERPDLRSKDATLSLLKINDKNIPLTNAKEYNLTLKHDIDRTRVEVETTDKKASAEYENIDLVDGDNTLVVRVIAENGNSEDYTIHIKRLTIDESITLESIKIVNHDILFDINKNTYDVKVSEDEKSLNFIINPNGIDYEIEGNSNLNDGSIVKVKVKDNDGEKIYTFNIHKDNNNSNILYILVFGLGVISLVGSVIYAIKVKKNFTKK